MKNEAFSKPHISARDDFHKRAIAVMQMQLLLHSDRSLGSYMSFTYWISARPCQYTTHTRVHINICGLRGKHKRYRWVNANHLQRKRQLVLWKEQSRQSSHTKDQTCRLWTCIALKRPQMMSFLCAYINISVCLLISFSCSVTALNKLSSAVSWRKPPAILKLSVFCRHEWFLRWCVLSRSDVIRRDRFHLLHMDTDGGPRCVES